MGIEKTYVLREQCKQKAQRWEYPSLRGSDLTNRPHKLSEARFLLHPAWLQAGQAAGQCCTGLHVRISSSEPLSPVDPSAERGWVDREEEEADIWLESAEPGDVCGA